MFIAILCAGSGLLFPSCARFLMCSTSHAQHTRLVVLRLRIVLPCTVGANRRRNLFLGTLHQLACGFPRCLLFLSPPCKSLDARCHVFVYVSPPCKSLDAWCYVFLFQPLKWNGTLVPCLVGRVACRHGLSPHIRREARRSWDSKRDERKWTLAGR